MTAPTPTDTHTPLPTESARGRLLSWTTFGLVIVSAALLCEARLWRPGDVFTGRENPQIAEALSWWEGRLDIPERNWDTAIRDGKVYSHFPPAFTFISAAVAPWFDGVPHVFIVVALALPLLLLSLRLGRSRTGATWAAIAFLFALVFGTSLHPVLEWTIRGGGPYVTNQTLAVIGQLILLGEYFGRRRVLIGGLGFVLAALSRQLCIAYALPYLYMAIQPDLPTGTAARPSVLHWNRIALSVALALVPVATTLTLNGLKFGHPLDSGYMRIYDDRPEDVFSRDARTFGLFSPHYVPRNLYYMNLGPPNVHRVEIEDKQRTFLRPNRWGTGIWWTSPILLLLFVDLRRILRSTDEAIWLASVGLVFVALMFYHSTGYEQRGFNRYSLDFVPVLMALIAPCAFRGKRLCFTVPAVAWSVLYFRWLI